MKKIEKEPSEFIKMIRDICKRLDIIENKIDSGTLNAAILPDYIKEQNRLNAELIHLLIINNQ